VIDSHTHLGLCDPPDIELVAEATQVGVNRLLNVGTDGVSSRAALAAAEDFPQVFAAVGRHPNSATGLDDADLADLAALAAHPRCVAIGETGLDFFRDYAPAEDQRRAFSAQIALARECAKPLIIHTRAADDETLAILAREAAGVRVIMHCFSMHDRVDECVEAGYWISFAGNVTYKNNGQLAEAALRVPAERILVETDAPYLTPVPRRGKPNTPAGVVDTALFVAELRGVAYEELDRDVERNAAELFGW
jgi:TatD DNase family protein